MRNTLYTCVVCKDIFRTRLDLNNHVRCKHQSVIKVKFQTDGATEVKKGMNDTFKCVCEKEFKVSMSLQRHMKNCNDESIDHEQNEMKIELMNDSDVSKL